MVVFSGSPLAWDQSSHVVSLWGRPRASQFVLVGDGPFPRSDLRPSPLGGYLMVLLLFAKASLLMLPLEDLRPDLDLALLLH